MNYHASPVCWPLDGAGGDERVVVSRLAVPENPRVSPHPFVPRRALAPLLVVSRVFPDERAPRVLAPADQILRRSRSRALGDAMSSTSSWPKARRWSLPSPQAPPMTEASGWACYQQARSSKHFLSSSTA